METEEFKVLRNNLRNQLIPKYFITVIDKLNANQQIKYAHIKCNLTKDL